MIVFLFLILSIVPGPRLDLLEYLVFPEGEGFTIITTDSIYHTLNGKDFSSRKHFFAEDIYRLDLVPTNDPQKFFIANGGGVVLKYENDTLQRVDQSYRWRSRNNSLAAAANDTIYLFGGYGEFTFYNDLLRFDESTREWVELPVQEPRPSRMSNAIGHLDVENRSLYVGFGSDSRYVDKRSTYRPFYTIGRFDLDGEYFETLGSMEFIQEFQNDVGVKYWRSFPHYKLPFFYSNRYLIMFDFAKGVAHLHNEADYSTIEQFSEILSYNPVSNKFLIGGDLTDRPRYLVINELDLLGRHYTVFEMKKEEAQLNKYLIGIALLFVIGLFYLFSGKKQQLIDLINQNQKRIKLQLSDEDFNVLQIIIDSYPNFVDYPELQNSFERDLSYESRIKKLRTTIKVVDDAVQSALKIKGSVFEIERGKEDKRVKVIRLKDQSFKFSKLRSFLPF
ncbi:MAG: N-acetylneuraminate epimerase [Flavobacteriaceae bacterium]|nr:MAG: N-acetylneuraminate epimerase [Flavobacteriaceae bacterium]